MNAPLDATSRKTALYAGVPAGFAILCAFSLLALLDRIFLPHMWTLSRDLLGAALPDQPRVTPWLSAAALASLSAAGCTAAALAVRSVLPARLGRMTLAATIEPAARVGVVEYGTPPVDLPAPAFEIGEGSWLLRRPPGNRLGAHEIFLFAGGAFLLFGVTGVTDRLNAPDGLASSFLALALAAWSLLHWTRAVGLLPAGLFDARIDPASITMCGPLDGTRFPRDQTVAVLLWDRFFARLCLRRADGRVRRYWLAHASAAAFLSSWRDHPIAGPPPWLVRERRCTTAP